MSIPKTRQELTDLLITAFSKLIRELDDAGPKVAKLRCFEDWTVQDLLAIRAWWTESVIEWIETGQQGKLPSVPAPGYTWRETPRLNSEIVEAARSQTFAEVRGRLETGFARVLATIDELDDIELLQVGVFGWTGKWPVSRWISVNTARQYTTARAFVRRALRAQKR